MVGLPFLVVSTTAPLLHTPVFKDGAPRTPNDPYFLYGASNLGRAAPACSAIRF